MGRIFLFFYQVRWINSLLFSSCRVSVMSDQLEREEDVTKRLARLEEQVVTSFSGLLLMSRPRVARSFETRHRWEPPRSLGHIVILMCLKAEYHSCNQLWDDTISFLWNSHGSHSVSPGCPVSESPAVDHGQSEISRFRNSRSPTIPSETLILFHFDSPPAAHLRFYCELSFLFHQCWQRQTSPATPVPWKKRTDFTSTPVSFTTRTVKSPASLCPRRRCHGRYFTAPRIWPHFYLFSTFHQLVCWLSHRRRASPHTSQHISPPKTQWTARTGKIIG